MMAYFGTKEFPDMDKMDLAANGDIIPKIDPNKVMLKTQLGDELVISNLQKTPEYKSGKDFNAGDVGEAALGAGVYAVFINQSKYYREGHF